MDENILFVSTRLGFANTAINGIIDATPTASINAIKTPCPEGGALFYAHLLLVAQESFKELNFLPKLKFFNDVHLITFC